MKIIPTRRIPHSTYRAGILQSRAYRALNTYMTKSISGYGLSVPQWAALGVLYDEKQTRPSALAETLGVKTPVATRLLNELSRKDLTVRSPYSEDKRGAVVIITPQGVKLVRTIERDLRKNMQDFLSGIKISELLTYIKVLSKLSKKL